MTAASQSDDAIVSSFDRDYKLDLFSLYKITQEKYILIILLETWLWWTHLEIRVFLSGLRC